MEESSSLPYSRRQRSLDSRRHDTQPVKREYSDLYISDSARNSRENQHTVDGHDDDSHCCPSETPVNECKDNRTRNTGTLLVKGGGEDEEHVMFSCNICYDMASEPVVTLCGHLYCWPCLYRWLQMRNNLRTCPVCKAGVDRDKVIPVYGRGGNGDPRLKKMDQVPLRPSGQRPAPVDARGGIYMGGGQQGMHLPNLFGLAPSSGEYVSPEQHHQAFLSRLLLMLGSFVIMCLLLF